MIYTSLRSMYDIISVPYTPAGVYHRTKCDIISKVYHPFRKGTDIIERNHFCPVDKSGFFHGGEGEIRTLATVSRPTPLAGAPLHQLEYFSTVRRLPTVCFFRIFSYGFRKSGGESGIRTHGSQNESPVFKTGSLNHSDISPNKTNAV